MRRRDSPFHWAICVSVDGREVHQGTMMHTTSSAFQYTVSHMTFKENGVAYEGRLKFAALVSHVEHQSTIHLTVIENHGQQGRSHTSRSAVGSVGENPSRPSSGNPWYPQRETGGSISDRSGCRYSCREDQKSM